MFALGRAEHILREIRAVESLCRDGVHSNIVPVLRHGELDRDFYFIDMVLCDLSLENYIQKSWTPKMRNEVPKYTMVVTPRTACSHAWEIMEDIMKGLKFVHEHGHIHRDLKPRNGPSGFCYRLTDSTLFQI